MPLTFKQAQADLRTYGMSLRHEDGEYRVNFSGSKDDRSAYYATDLEDAVNTGKQLAESRQRALEAAAKGDPSLFGYTFKHWMEELQDHLKFFGRPSWAEDVKFNYKGMWSNGLKPSEAATYIIDDKLKEEHARATQPPDAAPRGRHRV